MNGLKKFLNWSILLILIFQCLSANLTSHSLCPLKTFSQLKVEVPWLPVKLKGVVKIGEEVDVIGLKAAQKTTVTGIEMFNKQLQEGQAGDNAGILLRGLKKEDVHRGQVIAKPGSVTPHTDFESEVYILKKEEGGRHTPFFTGYKPQFYIRTTDVTVKLH